MKNKDNNLLLNTAIAFTILVLTVFGYYINQYGDILGALLPAAGFLIGFYLIYHNRIIVGLIVGIFIGHMIGNIFILGHELWFGLAFSVYVVLAEILFIYIFKRILIESKTVGKIGLSPALMYLLSTLVSSFIVAALIASFQYLVLPNIRFIDVLTLSFIGYSLGIGIFGVTLAYINYYKEELFSNVFNFPSVIFFVIYILLSLLIFYPFKNGYLFNQISFIYILLFMVPAYIFKFRTLMTASIFYIVFAYFFYIIPQEPNIGNIAMITNLYLLILVFSSSVTRTILYNVQKKNDELEESQDQVEELINSTFAMMRLGEHAPFKEDVAGAEYLRQLFNAANKIFKNYDSASCYIRGEEFVNFIDAVGYDVEHLNKSPFRIEEFNWNSDIPEHIVDSSKLFKQTLKDNYAAFADSNKLFTQTLKDKYIDIVDSVIELKETICFSVFVEDNIVGGISFDILQGSDKKFTPTDYENIRVFQRIMNGFYETRTLYAKNSSLKDDIVMSLIRTLELYDQYTGGHSEEVAYLGLQIAQKMKLPEQDQYNIYWAGIVHDIGKVGIPTEILNKPERLSLEEYEIIKSHPLFGYEILKKSKDLEAIARLVRHHHEWWNGTGYPDGLKANQIPLGAQIINVCDAVSSMATKRPYTIIHTSQQILEELELYSGTQFSPLPAQMMIEFIKEGKLDSYYKNRE